MTHPGPTVRIPRKTGVATIDETVVAVWPLVEAALDVIGADAITRAAARAALATSDGCAVLANYLNSEAKRVHRMDYRFKVPLIVLAADLARADGGADAVYCPDEGCVYFETDEAQYSFHVFKDWTVAWETVAPETIPGYEWAGEEHQTWALDRLLTYLPDDEPSDPSA
jgi:hypothetical protein